MALERDDPCGLARFGARLTGVKLYKHEKRLVAELKLTRLISAREEEEIKAGLGGLCPGTTAELGLDISDAPRSGEALYAAIRDTMGYFSPLMRPALRCAIWEGDGQKIAFTAPEKLGETISRLDWKADTEAFFLRLYGMEISVEARFDPSMEVPLCQRDSNGADDPIGEDSAGEAIAPRRGRGAGSAKKGQEQPGFKKSDILLGKPTKQKPMPMAALTEDMGTVTVSGEMLLIEARSRKDEGLIVNIRLTDKTNTLPVKLFLKKEQKHVADRLERCRENGDYIAVHGRFSRDDFLSMYCIFADWIYRVDRPQRMDRAERKRVELHLHTCMSAQDALVKPADAVGTAARWGHSAVAITDHGVVQAFPAVAAAADASVKAGKPVKAILGTEGYLIPDCRFLPFDTGFCSIHVLSSDETGKEAIFALAASKMALDGTIAGRFFTLCDCGLPVTAGFEAQTGITGAMVSKAPTLGEALGLLSGFIGSDCIVAHDEARLLSLHRRARALDVDIPSRCVSTSKLAHYLHREIKDLSLKGVLAALLPDGKADTPEDAADAILKLLALLKKDVMARGAKALPLTDCGERPRGRGRRNSHHVIIIARTQEGLKNLYRLISYSHLEHLRGVPQIPKSLLMMHREGLIVGSACEAGELFTAVLEARPREELLELAAEYDYLEIQPVANNAFLVREGRVADEEGLRELNRRIVALGEELSIPVVATGDVHFLEPEDALYRTILMSAREFKDAEQQAPLYFKTTDEMLDEFAYLGADKAMEVVVDNPNAIADSCDRLSVFPDEKETYAPRFENAEEDLRRIAELRAHEIYGEELPEIVGKRLERELSSIIGNGYASLYLMAQQLTEKSTSDGYLVGSRGSVGSSFVATMAGITEVNPLGPHYVCPNCKHSDFEVDRLKYSCGVDMPDQSCPICGTKYDKRGYAIPFEVFLGFEGDKTPDIDLNFSGDYQSIAHKYTETMFGEGHAFRAGTITVLKDKTAFIPVRKYCEQQGLNLNRYEVERLIQCCTGVKSSTGQHPGAIIIVPQENDIMEFTPIQYPADKKDKNVITTHFDFNAMHDKLVKLDILAHVDPTALKMLADLTGLDPRTIPLDDPQTMRLYSSIEPIGISLDALECDVGTLAIPEFGTPFVRKLLMDTRPTTMEELVRISGLSHGTDVWVGNAQDLVLGGMATLSEVICTRDDIMNYLILRGGEPSMSFKTMESVRKGKGITADMEEAMRRIDTPQWFIESCKRIKYMFPRAHAAAYVMMGFRIAYYKVHHPLEFYAAYFTLRAPGFDVALSSGGAERVLRNLREIASRKGGGESKEKDDKILAALEVVYEMNLRGIELLPVDLYRSAAKEFRIEDGAIRPPFSAVAGVGENAAVAIEQAQKDGPFTSVADFELRTKANSAVIERLRAMGCFKGLEESNQMSLFSVADRLKAMA